MAVLLHLIVGALVGPYAVGHQRGSFEEAADIVRTVISTTAVLFAWAVLVDPVLVPRSVPLVSGVVALSAMAAARFLLRAIRTRKAASRPSERRAIVLGAGQAGRHLVRGMLRDEDSDLLPVALLDDDRTKRRLAIDGVRVRGTRSDLVEVAQKYDASAVVVAIPRADSELLRHISQLAAEADLDVLTLPPLSQMVSGTPSSRDLRDLDLNDLLGRRPISLDTTLIAEKLAGRSILVTGAGGSIGSELCRQIARFGPGKLYLLDRDESGLQATQMSLTGQGLLDNDEVVLADIRDLDTMRDVFRRTRPDVVFHAAALKHLPLLERYPLEAWKSNVVGTLNVLTGAAEQGVGTFVNISTDKAADPTCVLGYSKRVAERLTAQFAVTQPGVYVSVRFGNVLGSRGSVVLAFTAQIERGGPVTVTHPEVERYFMLIPEACQLVLEACAIGRDGDVMVLDMGEPVRIVDVARTLIKMSGRRGIDIKYTGLRLGEKLTEGLFAPDETVTATANPLITSVTAPPLATEAVRTARPSSDATASAWMRRTATVSMASHDSTPQQRPSERRP
ncbi:nucleoside-diphosphate sugar epimerase/dehydratase [Actinotalea ferrariae]|uniref:nucleoside-diphosphate sugar epimerase/dehydratase n=1 Tax=Actinotalea ferrariae TaxID=1386098 RepID=UPI001FDF6D29|nr:nucleoside-diphosphate sugar epimerase/dehydratase [Actinotalea ferrariae]